MSSRIDKHLTLDRLKQQIDALLQAIKDSDKLDFGQIKDHGKTEKHAEVLAINRQFNHAKRLLLHREKDSVDKGLMHLVKQLTEANGGDINQTKAILNQAQYVVHRQQKMAEASPTNPPQTSNNSSNEEEHNAPSNVTPDE